jgi:hypothetical protein
MKTKFFSIAALISAIFYSACSPIEGGNYVTPSGLCAVVDYDYNYQFGGNTIIRTNIADVIAFAAPSLSSLAPDSTLFIATMKVDYDNQPSANYLTATEINPIGVNKRFVSQVDEIDETDYLTPLSLFGYVSTMNLKGRLFFSGTYTLKSGQGLDFKLNYNEEEAINNGVVDLYFQVKLTGDGTGGEKQESNIFAIDARPLIYSLSRDTVIGNVNLKYLKANIKYVSSVTNGVPEFKYANLNDTQNVEPFNIYYTEEY